MNFDLIFHPATFFTDLLRSATPGKEVAVVVAMEGDVQYVGIVVEGLLTSVAMVNILRFQEDRQWEGYKERETREKEYVFFKYVFRK